MLVLKVKVMVIIKKKKKKNLGTLRTIPFWFNDLPTLLPGSQYIVTVRQKHINWQRQPSPVHAVVAPRSFTGLVLIGTFLCPWAFFPRFISHPGWETLLSCNSQHQGQLLMSI